MGSASPSGITVVCTTLSFTVGGNARSGLQGSGLTLTLNGGDTIAVSSNGGFLFPGSLPRRHGLRRRHRGTAELSDAVVLRDRERERDHPGEQRRQRPGLVLDHPVLDHRTDHRPHRLGPGAHRQRRRRDRDPRGLHELRLPGPRCRAAPRTTSKSRTPPSGPTQVCTPSANTGNVGAGDVGSVVLDCSVSSFTLSGTVNGPHGERPPDLGRRGRHAQRHRLVVLVRSPERHRIRHRLPDAAEYAVGDVQRHLRRLLRHDHEHLRTSPASS